MYINSWYDRDTKLSKAVVGGKYGHFTAYAKLAKEDEDVESSFAGCEYAEIKALIKYKSAAAATWKAKADALSHILKTYQNSKTVNKWDDAYKIVESQQLDCFLHYEQLRDEVKNLKEYLVNFIQMREEASRKLQEKIRNKNKVAN